MKTKLANKGRKATNVCPLSSNPEAELTHAMCATSVNCGIDSKVLEIHRVLLNLQTDCVKNEEKHETLNGQMTLAAIKDVQMFNLKAERQVDKACQTRRGKTRRQDKVGKEFSDLKSIAADAVRAADAFKERSDRLQNKNLELHLLLRRERGCTTKLQAQVSELQGAMLKLQNDLEKCHKDGRMFNGQTNKHVEFQHPGGITEVQEDAACFANADPSVQQEDTEKKSSDLKASDPVELAFKQTIDHLQNEIQELCSLLRQRSDSSEFNPQHLHNKRSSRWRKLISIFRKIEK